MKKIFLIIAIGLISFSSFSQNKATDASIMQLMSVKKGMNEITTFTAYGLNHINANKATSFTAIIETYKVDLVSKSLAFFRDKYTADQIASIYTECTSDIINYTDLTNGFFRDWRKLKGDLFHRHTKAIIRQHQ